MSAELAPRSSAAEKPLSEAAAPPIWISYADLSEQERRLTRDPLARSLMIVRNQASRALAYMGEAVTAFSNQDYTRMLNAMGAAYAGFDILISNLKTDPELYGGVQTNVGELFSPLAAELLRWEGQLGFLRDNRYPDESKFQSYRQPLEAFFRKTSSWRETLDKIEVSVVGT